MCTGPWTIPWIGNSASCGCGRKTGTSKNPRPRSRVSNQSLTSLTHLKENLYHHCDGRPSGTDHWRIGDAPLSVSRKGCLASKLLFTAGQAVRHVQIGLATGPDKREFGPRGSVAPAHAGEPKRVFLGINRWMYCVGYGRSRVPSARSR